MMTENSLERRYEGTRLSDGILYYSVGGWKKLCKVRE